MRFISYLLTVVLIINSMLLGIANAAKFVALNNTLPQDVLVICTGSEIKYISQSIYYETGSIAEIKLSDYDLPDFALTHFDTDNTCPVDQGLEKSNALQNQTLLQTLTILGHVPSFAKLSQQPYSLFAFVLLPSRAPPTL